jgi:serine/threonine-protein kinase PknG
MTTTATTCTRPGCGGTIEGGYCDTCGLAPAAGGAGAAGAAGADTASAPGQPPAPSGSGARPVPSGSGSGSARSSLGSGSGRTGSRRLRAGSSRASRGHLGAGLVEIPPVRFGLERCYRAQARQAPDQHGRVKLVDLANYVRPGTWT